MTTAYVLAEAKPEAAPWAAERFQVQRNGTRYYADQMPPCALIPDPHADPVPGFSSLKPSKPFRKSVTVDGIKMTVPLDAYNMGEWLKGRDFMPSDLANPEDARAFYLSANVARDRNFARGHAIHRVAEAFLLGKPTNTETNVDAQPYLPHLIAWLEANVTDVHALEAVVFGNGYGGTGDAWLNVRGVPAYVDFKSRGADSAHGVYEEELCQVGAYTSARYCILPSDDRQTAVRAPVPAATFGLILSIRPDGVEEFWAEVPACQEAFTHLHNAYKSSSDAGKLARKAKVKDDPTTTVATSKRMPKATTTTPATVRPDEGAEVDPADVAPLRERYVALDPTAKAWVDAKRAEALAAGVDIHLKDHYTARRVAIMSGLVTLAEHSADDEVVHILTEQFIEPVWTTAGQAVGHLGWHDAETFANACRRYVGEPVDIDRAADLFGGTLEEAS